MSARDEYPLRWTAARSTVPMYGEEYEAAMTGLDSLRAELSALRTAVVRWATATGTDYGDRAEEVIALIPDDNWGITL